MNYLLFAYNQYYPLGGVNDLIGEYATLEEAKAAVNEKGEVFRYGNWWDYDNIEIVTAETDCSVVSQYDRTTLTWDDDV